MVLFVLQAHQKNKTMKKVWITIAIFALPFALVAQQPLQQFFDKYAGEEGFTSVNVTADLFALMSSIEAQGDAEMEEMKAALEGLESIQVLTYEAGEGQYRGDALYDEAIAGLDFSAYKELVRVKDAAENVRIVAKELGDGKISQLLILVGSPEEFVFVNINGVIDLNALLKMSGEVNMEGLDKLKKLEQDENKGTQAEE